MLPALPLLPLALQVQDKSIAHISRELALLQQLAAAGKLMTESLSGGTISISNIGRYLGGKPHCDVIIQPPVYWLTGSHRTRPVSSLSNAAVRMAAAPSAPFPPPSSSLPNALSFAH